MNLGGLLWLSHMGYGNLSGLGSILISLLISFDNTFFLGIVTFGI